MTQLSPDPHEPRPLLRATIPASEPAPAQDEIALRDLFLKVWRGKWIILATVAAIVGLVTLWLKIAEPVYTARMVIAPAAEASGGAMASGLSRYLDVASSVGIDLPSEQALSTFDQFTELVKFVTLAQRLEEKYRVLPKVFDEWWDAQNDRWQPPQGIVGIVLGRVRAFFGLPSWAPPSSKALAEYLQEELRLTPVGATAMRVLEFDHKDPQFAVQFLRWIHREGDELIREEAEERTSRQLAYIESKLATVTVAELRLSLVELLSAQEKRMMMIKVDLPFAARIIEPPFASEAPTFPKPILALALAVAGGLFVGVFLVFLIDALREGEPRSTPSPAS